MAQIHMPLAHEWLLEMDDTYRLFENHTGQHTEYVVLQKCGEVAVNFEIYKQSFIPKKISSDSKFHIFNEEKRILLYHIPLEEEEEHYEIEKNSR